MKTPRRLRAAVAAALGALLSLAACERTPVVTHEWVEDGEGWRQFYTSDRGNYNTVFVWWDEASLRNPLDTTAVKAKVKRVSGSDNGMYGVAFGLQDAEDYYCLLITAGRDFAVFRVEGGVGVLPPIKDWSTSSLLFEGYDQENKIEIDYTLATRSFSVLFNDIKDPSASFVDATWTQGRAGYVAIVLGNDDEFLPRIPVDVRFQMEDPITDPP